MKQVCSIFVIFLISLVISVPVSAKNKTYIYRSRANWVKFSKLSNKQLAGRSLSHPYTDVSTNQMINMLLSLEMNKAKLFKKGQFKTSNIFSPVEARKYAPLITKALSLASPNQVINISIVHKRSFFVVRNDYISIINVFATAEGIHFNFSKLFARLDGDYQQASRIDRSIREAKSLRVGLQVNPGQILVADSEEVILNPSYNYAANLVKNDSQSSPNLTATQPHKTTIATDQSSDQNIRERLSKLEDLKNSKLISNSEYKKKRKEILKNL